MFLPLSPTLAPQFTGTERERLATSRSFARGAAFAPGGRLTALAQGGALTNAIVKKPTVFRFVGGAGPHGRGRGRGGAAQLHQAPEGRRTQLRRAAKIIV